MRRNLFTLLAAVAIAGTFASAQGQSQGQSQPATPAQPAQPAQPGSQGPATPAIPATPATPSARSQSDADSVTLTGCLVQGSGPNVFVLENAKASTASATDKGKSYVLAVAPGSTAVDFKGQLNRQVRIVGSADKMAAAATGAAGGASASAAIRVDEKDMPKLSARTIARVGDTCPSA